MNTKRILASLLTTAMLTVTAMPTPATAQPDICVLEYTEPPHHLCVEYLGRTVEPISEIDQNGKVGLVTIELPDDTFVTVPGYGPESACDIYDGIAECVIVFQTNAPRIVQSAHTCGEFENFRIYLLYPPDRPEGQHFDVQVFVGEAPCNS